MNLSDQGGGAEGDSEGRVAGAQPAKAGQKGVVEGQRG